jgi:ATP-dependent DNA helicase RecG
MLSDNDLCALLQQPESNWLERKRNAKNEKDKIHKTICAFANALADSQRQGVILIGIEDDGSICGVPNTDLERRQVDEIREGGNIQPLPSLVTRSFIHPSGKALMAIIVQPSYLPPVRYEGKIYVRMSASTRAGNLEDEKQLFDRRRKFASLSFDSEGIPSVELSSLDENYFEQTYLPNVIDREVLRQNGRTLEEKFVTTRMAAVIENKVTPTVAGILTVGHSPQDWLFGAYVQYVRYAGTQQGGEILDAVQFTGNLETVIRQTEDKIKSNIRVHTDITSQDLEVKTPNYPLAALQQLFRNAILHRNYEGTNTPVRIYWFDDRVEIVSPGGLFGNVTTENLGKPFATDYRNPVICEAMKALGFVQKFGFGIQNAQQLLSQNGNEPATFEVNSNFVLVTVKQR